MGVTGIWEHMHRYAESVCISHLRNKVLAIDGHIWLYESARGCSSHGISGASYLVTFFNRCQRLREYGIEPIVVFDQISPSFDASVLESSYHVKKSKRIGGNGWNLDAFNDLSKRVYNVQALLRNLGIRCLVGGADGEAQCAQLEQASITDGCITTDFDYFLFGGRNLYKIEFTGGGRGINTVVSRFSMEKFEQTQNLTRSRLVVLALLLGCDYFEGGVGRVGMVTALEIISEFSLHEDDHALSILDRFSSYYRQEVPERSTDSTVKRKLRNAKIYLPDGFPNTDLYGETVSVYLNPKVTLFANSDLPKKSPTNMKVVEQILEKECGWKPERFSQELGRSQRRARNIRKSSHQPKLTGFFTPRRRSAPVVAECSKEESRHYSRREWAALEKLRSKAMLYAVDAVVEEEPITQVQGPRSTTRRRPPKRSANDGTSPTTSTPKLLREMGGGGKEDGSSVKTIKAM